ncbi:hemerythrin domain-containing protein [Pseudoalteromonas tunicata]|uniref:hemerythrin domain-containing protein n=1 Tax=Pseudoalteromonas tunicata TaxID=314281 RepID=UPI00273D7B44|nr:hemerythrin domain-containing protein [Pseudoalteromonas tunicata]MDP4984232.1 hemerythrin domain-containing protein [Pseudoalteromonas tunicata]MDP5213438.1 hemerythrin domain-containing protein [Pseudoalteromonas tunicata]
MSLSIFNAFKQLTTHTSKQQRCYSFDAANLARIQEITDSNTLSHYFEADHKRLDLFAEQFSHYLMILPQLASRYFTAFAQGLTAHIVAEETVLFPFFEEKTGLQQGPTVTMRQEHQQIITLLSLISEKLAQQHYQIAAEYNQLNQLLARHNKREENILYPMLDQHSNDQEKAELFLKLFEATALPHCGPCTAN